MPARALSSVKSSFSGCSDRQERPQTYLDLFCKNLIAIVNVDALLWLVVKRTTHQVKVAMSSVGVNSRDGLDVGGNDRRRGDVGTVMNVISIGQIAIAHGAHASVVKHRVVLIGTHARRRQGRCVSRSARRCRRRQVEATECVEFGIGIVVRGETCPGTVLKQTVHVLAVGIGRGDAAEVAKRLIATCATPTLQETANLLGFSEPTSFYRFFKRATGMTAKQYR